MSSVIKLDLPEILMEVCIQMQFTEREGNLKKKTELIL